MVTSLPTRMRSFTGVLFASVGGVPTQVLSVETSHGVDQLIGTCTIEVPLPAASQLQLNARIDVQAGFTETSVAPIFSGRLIDSEGTVDDGGLTARYRAEGWAALLNFGDPKDLIFQNSSSLYGIFRSLCQRRGVPMFQADSVTDNSGTQIRFGGNSYVDDRNVILQRDQSVLTWLDSAARMFGYRVFDTPSGVVRLMRINGLPPGSPVGVYAEGINAYRFTRRRDLKQKVTYWEVRGARWTDNDGVATAVRSIPASVPYSADLDPPGYRKSTLNDARLVNQSLAVAARNAKEIETGQVYELDSWEIHGDAQRAPGDVVQLTSSTLLLAGANRWLTSLRQTVSDAGYLVTMEGWAGGGSALPAGNDTITLSIRSAAVHLGDETIPWYAQPTPSGKTFTIHFNVPDDYTAIVLSGYAHGSNSYLLDNANTDSSVSKLEVWQNGAKVGSTDLPVLAENYEAQLPYWATGPWTFEDGSTTSDVSTYYWSAFRLPVPGQLKAGDAEIRIISGEDKRLPDSTKFDDFEVKLLNLSATNAGQPSLPGER